MPLRVSQLNHVALSVSNLDDSLAFYADILGLEELPRPDFDFPGAWLRLGPGQELHLLARDKPQMPSAPVGHFALFVDNIDEAAAHLDLFALAYRGPKRRPDGATQIFIADPDGHVVELTGNFPK